MLAPASATPAAGDPRPHRYRALGALLGLRVRHGHGNGRGHWKELCRGQGLQRLGQRDLDRGRLPLELYRAQPFLPPGSARR